MVAFSAQGSNLQCVSFTVLRVAVFNSDSPVSEGRQLNTTWPVPGSCNSIDPVSMRGTKLSMYATSSSVASAGSSNCSRPHPLSSISRMRFMFLSPRSCLAPVASKPATHRQKLRIFGNARLVLHQKQEPGDQALSIGRKGPPTRVSIEHDRACDTAGTPQARQRCVRQCCQY